MFDSCHSTDGDAIWAVVLTQRSRLEVPTSGSDHRKRRHHQIIRHTGTWLGIMVDQIFIIQLVQVL